MANLIVNSFKGKVANPCDVISEDESPESKSVVPILGVFFLLPRARCHTLDNQQDLVEEFKSLMEFFICHCCYFVLFGCHYCTPVERAVQELKGRELERNSNMRDIDFKWYLLSGFWL